MKKVKRILIALFLIAVTVVGYGAWILLGSKKSNPNNYKTIGDISTPWGYERVNGDDAAYSEFLRSLPLKGKGSDVILRRCVKKGFQQLSQESIWHGKYIFS